MDGADWTVHDLNEVIRLGLERGGSFLTRGETSVAQRILDLPSAPARVYGRLVQRKPRAFERGQLNFVDSDTLDRSVAHLTAMGLFDGLVPRSWRAELTTRAKLVVEARRLGLRVGGRKAELAERLVPHPQWQSGSWIRIRHRPLIRRLERWALMSRWRDRSMWVAERLEHTRWPDYPCTPGPGLHRDRRSLLAWEDLIGAELEPEAALQAMESGSATAGGRLDLNRRLARQLFEYAARQQKHAPLEALDVYDRLTRLGHAPAAVRYARALELAGDKQGAFNHLREARSDAPPEARIAIQRSGRRLARSLRRGWAPDPPLRSPPVRTLRLTPGPSEGRRPTWLVTDRAQTIEAAVIAVLATQGRHAVFAENALWRTLFALCFADAYFLPVPGTLPCRHLAGPLDLGTPDFAHRRPQETASLLNEIAEGGAPERVRRNDERWRGTHLSGANWSAFDTETLVRIAQGMGPAGLHAVMRRLLTQGFAAARGLPDLVILPGDAITLPNATPTQLNSDLQLVELKGPSDVVRDAQAVWFDHLLASDVPIALWEVRAQT